MFNFNSIEKKAKKIKELTASIELLKKEKEELTAELIHFVLSEGEKDTKDQHKSRYTAGIYKLTTFLKKQRFLAAGCIDQVEAEHPDFVRTSESQQLKIA